MEAGVPSEPCVVLDEFRIQLRPVRKDDLEMLQRFAVEPGLIGLDWSGFRDAAAIVRRFESDGCLGKDDGRLIVDLGDGFGAAGLVSFLSRAYAGPGSYWEIGIVLLPDYRGRGIGWRAQAMLCDYLFRHTPAQRLQASTHPENVAEQESLKHAGFTFEGTIRGAEFRHGEWRDIALFSRLRDDPSPRLVTG